MTSPRCPPLHVDSKLIVPRKIPINIQITYFRTWNSPTFRCFQLSTILFAFLQSNLDRVFWKIPTFYYFYSNYIIKIIFRLGNHPHSQWNRRSRVHHCLRVFCGLYLGYPTETTKAMNSSHGGYCFTWLKSRTAWEGLTEILQISLIETKTKPNRNWVKNPRETSIS